MWIERWNREDWVISRQGLFYLRCAFWAQLPFLLSLPFLVYIAFHSFLARPIGPLGLPLQLFLGLIGGVGAISGTVLQNAMKVFQRNRSKEGQAPSRFWRFMLSFAVFLGPELYYWFVYRPQVQEAGFR